MTKTKERKRRKLSKEILGLLVVTFLISLFLLFTLGVIGSAIMEHYLYINDIYPTEIQYRQMDNRVLSVSLIISVIFFVNLFLFLLGERLSYIYEVLDGIEALRNGQEDYVVPLEGSNELTQLAQAVNYLSQTQREVKEKEQALNHEKDLFIHTMSHDIRTPLTTIMSYTELMLGQEEMEASEQVRHLTLIHHKAEQIKDLTEILLDGSKRNLEHFENACLFMQQLAGEFEEMLEDDFVIETNSCCPAFSGTFDVQELRRIFDNLISNVKKYADPKFPVKLSVFLENNQLFIQQENAVRKPDGQMEGFQIGLRSIRRIVQNYGGRVDVQKDSETYVITIILSDI